MATEDNIADDMDQVPYEQPDDAPPNPYLEGGVNPAESYAWASSIILTAKDSTPLELLGTAHMVMQAYFINTQLHLIARFLAAPMEEQDAEDTAGN